MDQINDISRDEEVSAHVSTSSPFIQNTQTMMALHTILLSAADEAVVTAGPALLAWSILLRALNFRVMNATLDGQNDSEASRSGHLSSNDTNLTLRPDRYHDVMKQIMITLEEDVVDFIARGAVNHCRVFDTLSAISLRLGNTSDSFFSTTTGAQMRVVILGLIANSLAIGYIPEIIEATISALSAGESYWDVLDSKPLPWFDDPIAIFLAHDVLVDGLLETARTRIPLDSIPFLRMLRAVAVVPPNSGGRQLKSATDFLDTLQFFTYSFPPEFNGYETVQEEDNNNNIRSTRLIQLFEPRPRGVGNYALQGQSLSLMKVDQDFCIPAGSPGRVVSDSGPRTAFWYHEFSGLKYFGKLLETFLTASDLVDAMTGEPADRDLVGEIIGLLAMLLLGTTKSADVNPNSEDDALRILESASSGLSRNHDITTVIFDIFQQELQNQSVYSGADVPLDLLVSCVQFIHAMIPISPGRVWPLLSRSELLGVGGAGGRLSAIVESVELVSGRYELLISCCRLYESLVDDFTTNAMIRRSKGRPSKRFGRKEDVSTGVPNQVLSKIIYSFTRYMAEVFENSGTWKYTFPDDQRRLIKTIGQTFDKILRYAYGLESAVEDSNEEAPDDRMFLRLETAKERNPERSTKIMEALMPSASQLVDSYCSTTTGSLRFRPLLRTYFDGLETPHLTTYLHRLKLWISQVNTILSFSKTVLRLRIILDRPSSQVESQLFKASPLIARLYAVNEAYQNHVVALFEAMIVAASGNTSEPPSLLGHLGTQSARNFLRMLSDLDKPLLRDENITTIWHFLSMVVGSRQQWFANYVLTGRTPRGLLENKASGKDLATLDKPLLTTALEKLSNIDSIPRTEALAILEFTALAQNFWPWTVCDSPSYVTFIRDISEFVGNLKPIQQATNLDASIDACYQTRIAAYISEVLAMRLFHMRQKGVEWQAKDLIPNLSYFTRFAVAVPTYNTNLHITLERNFERQYPGCTIGDLKRTALECHHLGKEYFYNLPLADKMLQMDQAWTGRRDNGLRTEFAIANVNLSLVDAQIVSVPV